MRKPVLFLVFIAMVLAVAVPAGAAAWTEKVLIDATSHTSGGGTFYVRGVVVGSDADAHGTIEYFHPEDSYGEQARLRLVNLECIVVEPSEGPSGDYNVFVVGRLVVVEDDGDYYGDYSWGGFMFAADDYRPFAMPLYEEKPSCDSPVWDGAGYFDDGYVTVISR